MPNRLAQETSPYLRQHADNPVDWYPWSEPALTLAREQDKPILLSIGYSACHWCHVMAQESFADPEVAELMNRHFVNVKVDREERPDLDQIYQTALAVMTQKGGGWPLTMFLMPDGTPFFGGTYFPKYDKYNLPGLVKLLPLLAKAYAEQRGKLEEQNGHLLRAFQGMMPKAADPAMALTKAPVEGARADLLASFDAKHGGFGDAPKFPHVPELELLLSGDGAEALAVVRHSLLCMARGGIYDQLGGGFYRYSVDREWSIPHFEKMLYDNALLLRLYSTAWLANPEPLFAQVVEETAQWAMREMQSPAGGYYASLDADSEHEEGRFYLWTPQQVAALLDADEYAVLAPHFGLDSQPNYEERAWHLRVRREIAEISAASGRAREECTRLLQAARRKLFDARNTRTRPNRDEKILTGWNALMVKGMARAARAFERKDWLASARQAFDCMRARAWREGRLHTLCTDDTRHDGCLLGYLDDYAFLLDAALEMLQAEFRKDDLDFAVALADALLEKFEDPQAGGFFFTDHDHERLFHRPKPGHDQATPSGNGVAALALTRLGHLLGESRYLAAAERTVRLYYPAMMRYSGGLAALAAALEEVLEPPQIAVLRGAAQDLPAWLRRLERTYRPHLLALAIPAEMAGLPAALDKQAEAGHVNAWLCRGVICLPPVKTLTKLQAQLDVAGR
ncbi:MAG: thioredoxin domain-containing protein [Pseudomonadota bacterium]